MKIKFKSKIGLELAIPIVAVFGIVIFLSAMDNREIHWIIVAILLPVILFIGDIFINTHYTITDNFLKIKCGFFYNKVIEIKSIKKIKYSNNPLSAPATSLDRLEIIFNKNESLLVSPKNKVDFIETLKSINRNIEVM